MLAMGLSGFSNSSIILIINLGGFSSKVSLYFKKLGFIWLGKAKKQNST